MTREEFEQQSGEEVEETLDQDAADQEIEEVQEEEFDDKIIRTRFNVISYGNINNP